MVNAALTIYGETGRMSAISTIRAAVALALITGLSACVGAPFGGPTYSGPAYTPTPGQGQYVRPEYLAAAPTPMIPAIDACRSQLYAGLVGQHEGAIYIPGLPGRKRVLKPAFVEGFDYSQEDSFYDAPPFLEVQDYLPGQILYAPAIRTVSDRLELGPTDQGRLTIELDTEGYVQQIDCR